MAAQTLTNNNRCRAPKRLRPIGLAITVVTFVIAATLSFSLSGGPVEAQGDPVIYLTFDDGPVPQLTSPLLDTLDEFDAKATFFPVGLRVEQNRALVGDTFDRGHAIGNHSRTHPDLSSLTDAEIRDELNQSTDAIIAATGEAPTCMRPPNGTNDPRVNAISESLGLTPIFWNLGGGDYGLTDPQDFLDRVSGAQSGDIILLHDAAGQTSIDAARLVLEDFTSRGFRFESVPACRVGTPPTTTTAPPTTTTTVPPTTVPPTTPPVTTVPPTTVAPTTTTTPPGPGGAAIEIRAKGDIGNERIELRLNGSTVASYNLSRSYQIFGFTPASSITVNQLRVHFVNNGQDELGDRNVEIDYVNLNGQRFESEAPSVESIGSYRSDDGCRRGFKQSQRLACTGRFDYGVPQGTIIGAGSPGTTQPPVTQPPTTQQPTTTQPLGGGDEIQIRAKGDTGTEQISLQLDNQIVATWTVGTAFQTFSYDLPAGTAINQLRVRFINDARIPAGDRNVEIDYVVVDDTRYESESPATESRGSWNAATGCRPGFKQSQRLACTGYFQYAVN